MSSKSSRDKGRNANDRSAPNAEKKNIWERFTDLLSLVFECMKQEQSRGVEWHGVQSAFRPSGGGGSALRIG